MRKITPALTEVTPRLVAILAMAILPTALYIPAERTKATAEVSTSIQNPVKRVPLNTLFQEYLANHPGYIINIGAPERTCSP